MSYKNDQRRGAKRRRRLDEKNRGRYRKKLDESIRKKRESLSPTMQIISAATTLWQAYLATLKKDSVQWHVVSDAVSRNYRMVADAAQKNFKLSPVQASAVQEHLTGAKELFVEIMGREPSKASRDFVEAAIARVDDLDVLHGCLEDNRDGTLLLPFPQKRITVPLDSLKLQIASLPRCGTTWLSSALTDAGLPCGHEAWSTLGPVIREMDAGYEIDASGFVAPYTDHLRDRDISFILVTRHPQTWIGSARRYFLLEGKDRSGFEFACSRYERIMGHLANRACEIIQVEELWKNPLAIVPYLSDFGLTVAPEALLMAAPDARRGHSTPDTVAWTDLPSELQAVARDLGYGAI